MFRYYSTFNLIAEVEKELQRAQYLVQLLIDEYDFHYLGDALIQAANRGVNIEIGIIASSDKKTMKLVHLSKTLIDCGVEIYWCIEQETFTREDYFALFDKSYVITKIKQNESKSEETIFRQINDLFNAIIERSEMLKLLSGPIEISFAANESILYENQSFFLSWDVKNAHDVSIEPDFLNLSRKNRLELVAVDDKKYTLTAKNKDSVAQKSIFIKVIKELEIKFRVEGFDEILKEFVDLSPLKTEYSSDQSYAVYRGQKIKMSWSITSIGKLTETILGNMPLKGKHEFEVFSEEEFNFTFKSLQKSQFNKLSFYPFDSERIMSAVSKCEEVNFEEVSCQPHKNLIQKLVYFIQDLLRM